MVSQLVTPFYTATEMDFVHEKYINFFPILNALKWKSIFRLSQDPHLASAFEEVQMEGVNPYQQG